MAREFGKKAPDITMRDQPFFSTTFLKMWLVSHGVTVGAFDFVSTFYTQNV